MCLYRGVSYTWSTLLHHVEHGVTPSSFLQHEMFRIMFAPSGRNQYTHPFMPRLKKSNWMINHIKSQYNKMESLLTPQSLCQHFGFMLSKVLLSTLFSPSSLKRTKEEFFITSNSNTWYSNNSIYACIHWRTTMTAM